MSDVPTPFEGTLVGPTRVSADGTWERYVPADEVGGKVRPSHWEEFDPAEVERAARPPFRLLTFNDLDKWLIVNGPGDLELRVDFDDVNSSEVLEQTEWLVATLNEAHRTEAPS